ncbi:heme exporter protein CcmB [Chloroflexota bacterium]
MKKSLGKSFFILWKDVISELRTRDIITSVLVFALLVIVIFNFAFEPGTEQKELVAPGILWVSFTFAGVLSLGRSFVHEKEKACLEGLMLSPVDKEFVYLGKMLGSLIFMLIVEAIVFPIFLMLFNLPLFMPKLGLIALLATIGFVSVGTLFSAIAANTRARDIMLPILFFPIVTPVVIAAVKATGLVLEGEPWNDISSWLLILATFDIIFLVIPALVFEFIIEE